MPFYFQLLGSEAYGVIGFFILLQNWLNLLDVGLSATFCRQVAVQRRHKNGFGNFKNLLRVFELFFVFIASVILVIIYTQNDWLASEWLQSIDLQANSISYCIQIMGCIIALRFLSTLYRGGIIGFEDQVWLNKAIVGINALKYLGVFPVFFLTSASIERFFEYQLLAAMIETYLLGTRFYQNLPTSTIKVNWCSLDWSAFIKTLPFSMSIAYTSAIQLVVTQFDKLLLTGLLPLIEFGYLSIILAISGGIAVISVPIFTAFQPRLTIFAAAENRDQLLALYTDLCHIVTWIVVSATALIVAFSHEILFLFTGAEDIHVWGNEVLIWYSIGSCLYIIGSCPYYLQNAFGAMRLYVVAMTLSIIVLAPSMYFVATSFGALGASKLLFAYSFIWFFLFPMIVHKKFLPTFNYNWFLKLILPTSMLLILLGFVFNWILNLTVSVPRPFLAAQLFLISMVFIAISSISVPLFRIKIYHKIMRVK